MERTDYSAALPTKESREAFGNDMLAARTIKGKSSYRSPKKSSRKHKR
jgi:hypothetical protein